MEGADSRHTSHGDGAGHLLKCATVEINQTIPVVRYLPYFVGLIAMYLVAWTASYILTWVLRGDTIDFAYYFSYLCAAWTGGGLEVPQSMLILSVILFIPLAVIFLLVLKRRHAHRPHAA